MSWGTFRYIYIMYATNSWREKTLCKVFLKVQVTPGAFLSMAFTLKGTESSF